MSGTRDRRDFGGVRALVVRQTAHTGLAHRTCRVAALTLVARHLRKSIVLLLVHVDSTLIVN